MYLGALSHLNATLIPRISAHPRSWLSVRCTAHELSFVTVWYIIIQYHLCGARSGMRVPDGGHGQNIVAAQPTVLSVIANNSSHCHPAYGVFDTNISCYLYKSLSRYGLINNKDRKQDQACVLITSSFVQCHTPGLGCCHEI